ncbi:hypothetical protein L6452_14071 [Arctium lappa]|uniref:Uncharacterized protein n=1 Tax=Arctium lappa TaxID=4217 RepID=A0ACB9CK19_ARCLA|nr:hypothetical protein L6452_14071 [Arctium lappa]
MANVIPPYKVLLTEVELDACIDELSRECAALVLEEPMATMMQIMEERLEEIVLDIENHLWDEYEDCKGTGVFIPNAMKVEIPKLSKGTGVFIANASDLPKKRGGRKNSRIYIKKKKPGKPTTQYVQVSSKICLPEEWPYECYLNKDKTFVVVRHPHNECECALLILFRGKRERERDPNQESLNTDLYV